MIILTYNEEQNIEMVVEEPIVKHPELDYVVINDGSTDNTARICREKGYNLVSLPVNLELAGCFQIGIKYAYQESYSYTIQFDGDGQHWPEYIGDMRQKIEEGCGIVIGSRFADKPKGFSMWMIGSCLITSAARLTMGVRVADPTPGMWMFSKEMIKESVLGLGYGPGLSTISYLLKQGAKAAEMPVVITERAGGENYLRPMVTAWYMARTLISILLMQNLGKRSR